MKTLMAKKRRIGLPNNMPDRKIISDESAQIAKEWFDAAVNRDQIAGSPASASRKEKDKAVEKK